MDSSSDDSSGSDEEFNHLVNVASKTIREYSDDEQMDTDDGSATSSGSSDENDLEHGFKQNISSTNNVTDPNYDIELFTIDRKPMTASEKDIQIDNLGDKKKKRKRTKGKNAPNTNNDENQRNKKNNEFQLASEIGVGMELPGIYINVKPWKNPTKKMDEFTKLQKNSIKKDLKVMEKSVITPDFEREESLPKYHETVRKIKRDRKKLREMTKGKKWFDLPATDLSEDKKKSFEILQMRKALDPKRFYKSNDLTGFPKYSQFGTIVEGAADFYSSRIPKKQRKQTLVDELLADAEFRTYNKKKFEEIQSSKRRGTGAYQGSKRMINKKKGPMHRQPDKKQKKFFIDSSKFSKGFRLKK